MRLILLFGLLLLAPLALGLSSWLFLSAFLVLVVGFIFFRSRLWLLVVAALPVLALGQFLDLEVKPGWIYEMTLTEALFLAGVIIFLVDRFLSGKLADLKIDAISLTLTLYLLLALSSFFRVADLHFFAGEVKVIFFSLLGYFLAINLIDSDRKRKGFLIALILTVAILSVQLFLTILNQGFSAKLFNDRNAVALPVGAIALVSAILAFLLPLFLAYFFYLKPEEKIKPYLLIVFMAGLVAIALTMSKAAVLSLAAGFFYLFIKLKEKRVAFCLFFGTFMVLGYIMLEPFFAGLVQRVSNAIVDKNTRFRIDEYHISWKIIQQNWQLGVGVGEQPHFYERALGYEYRNLANNFFVQALVDLGVLGLILITWLVRKTQVFARRLKQRFAIDEREMILVFGLVGSLITAFINGLLEVTFFALPFALVFWPVVGAFRYKLSK